MNEAVQHLLGRMPGAARLRHFALALAIGVVGGAVFSYLGVPLAWMLGAMIGCLFAAISGVPVEPLTEIRPLMMAIIGTLLGAGFSVELLSELGARLPSLLALFVLVVACAGVGATYFVLVGGFDRPTAYFASLPGGLIEMTVLGERKGGDVRKITLVHSSRIFLVVVSIPYVMTWVHGPLLPAPIGGVEAADASLAPYLWIIGCGICGGWLGVALRMPLAPFLGPMIVSAIVHVTGLSEFDVPRHIVIGAQVVLGAQVGCSFVGTSRTLVLRVIVLSLGSVFLFVSMAVGFAYAISNWLDLPFEALLLSYVPGGITEMGLIALSLQIEAAFVAIHHIARLVFILITAGWLYRLAGLVRLVPD